MGNNNSQLAADETSSTVRPQHAGFYLSVMFYAGWLLFLGYLASLTW